MVFLPVKTTKRQLQPKNIGSIISKCSFPDKLIKNMAKLITSFAIYDLNY